MSQKKTNIDKEILKTAYTHLATAMAMTELYEKNKEITAKYVHATSRGHEVIQMAIGMQLLPQDYVYPYYRDDSILLGIGMTPYDLMLQLLTKRDDPFSGGRTYYSHPSLREEDKPKIPHQSSATGMQAIPATGAALGMQYKEQLKLDNKNNPLVLCSLGDASVTEGEVAEAFQMAALRQLPILYLIQDNEWDISANAAEIRAQDAYEYIQGFKGVEAFSIDGTDFVESYLTLQNSIEIIRNERRPVLIHAKVPLLNHHTSGVRMEWYRDDLEEHQLKDPFPKIWKLLEDNGFSKKEIEAIEKKTKEEVLKDYKK